MNTKISDTAIGAVIVSLAIVTAAFFLMRGDDCLEKARVFARTAPGVNARAGNVISVGTSSWLSGQTAVNAGDRSFYFLVRGQQATANVIVSADRASCTCRLESIH